MTKASDFFKAPHEVRAKAKYNYNEGITSYSNNVYAKNFTPTRTYRNSTNSFSTLLADEEISNIRLVDKDTKETYMFDKTFNNRVQYFYYGKDQKKIEYKEITNVEELKDTNGYYDLKQQGYNHFYNLYKKNPMRNNRVYMPKIDEDRAEHLSEVALDIMYTLEDLKPYKVNDD